MKNKLTKKNKKLWKSRFKTANGWPMNLWMYDRYSQQTLSEERGYAAMYKIARMKISKQNGFYETIFGFTPKNYKGKNK